MRKFKLLFTCQKDYQLLTQLLRHKHMELLVPSFKQNNLKACVYQHQANWRTPFLPFPASTQIPSHLGNLQYIRLQSCLSCSKPSGRITLAYGTSWFFITHDIAATRQQSLSMDMIVSWGHAARLLRRFLAGPSLVEPPSSMTRPGNRIREVHSLILEQ